MAQNDEEFFKARGLVWKWVLDSNPALLVIDLIKAFTDGKPSRSAQISISRSPTTQGLLDTGTPAHCAGIFLDCSL